MHYPLRIHIMGSTVDIKSPVTANDFLQGMVQLVNQRSADTSWTGYHQFETLNDEIVWIRVRAIDVVETLPELQEVKSIQKPKAKRKTKAVPKPKAKRKTTPKAKTKKIEPVEEMEEEKDDDIYG